MRDDISNDAFENSGPKSGSSVTPIKHVLMEALDEDITGNKRHEMDILKL